MRKLRHRIKIKLMKLLYSKARKYLSDMVTKEPSVPVRRYGTTYGGWCIPVSLCVGEEDLVFSVGAGEDISFEIEFLKKNNPKAIIIIDPTPRAIKHFQDLQRATAEGRRFSINQTFELYDMKGIDIAKLIYEAVAVWNRDGCVDLWAPLDERHVSYSITDCQRVGGERIRVPAVRIQTLVEKYGNVVPKLLKLDIEGAEVEVIQDMLSDEIFPEVVAIEYDELNYPDRNTYLRILSCDEGLRSCGYRLANFDGFNAIYILSR